MDILQQLFSQLLSSASDRLVLGGVTFAGVVSTIVGAYYLSGAIHETRVSRLMQLLSTVLLGGLAFGAAFYIGLRRNEVDSLIGLALGAGLGLGFNAWFPIQSLFHTPLGVLLNVGRAVTLILAGIVFAVLLTVAALPGLILALLIWGTLLLVTAPLFWTISKIGRRAITLDRVVTKVLGNPTRRSAPLFLLSPLLPNAPTAQWLFYGTFGLCIYGLMVIVGHLAALGSAGFLAPALRLDGGLGLSLLQASGFGIFCGYILFAPAVMTAYGNAAHDEKNAYVKSVRDEQSHVERVRESIENDDIAGTAGAMVGMGARGSQIIADSTLDKDVPEGGFSEEQKRAGAKLAREVISSASALNIGIMSAIAGGVIVSLPPSGEFDLIQRIVVIGLVYIVGGVIGRFSTAWAAVASICLVALGIAMQALQYTVTPR